MFIEDLKVGEAYKNPVQDLFLVLAKEKSKTDGWFSLKVLFLTGKCVGTTREEPFSPFSVFLVSTYKITGEN